MAIGTYDQLKASIGNWLERADLAAVIPDFIALCETRLNAELDLRTMESDVALTAMAGSRIIALPDGYRDAKALWRLDPGASYRQELRYVLPTQLVTDDIQSTPWLWTVDGLNIAFERPCDRAYDIVVRIVTGLTLSDTSQTNQILTNYPTLYLYGSLLEAAPYLRDADLLSLYTAKFEEALALAKIKEGRIKGQATLSSEITELSRWRTGNVYRDLP